MVEEAQLITKIKTAFPKEEAESEEKDIHGIEIIAVTVGILLSLAFITYSNSSSFFIMLIICLMGGFFGYFYQREKITEFISSIFNPSKKKPNARRDDKLRPKSKSKPHQVDEIIVQKPEKFPGPLDERLKLYKNNKTGEEMMKNRELNSGSSMFGGYHTIQPPVVSLNALRKSSVQPSRRRSIHEQVTNKVVQNSEWNRKNGNQLLKETMLKSKKTLNPKSKIFEHARQNLFVQE